MPGLEKLSPRESGIFIAQNSKDVFIREEAIQEFVSNLYEALEGGEVLKNEDHETFLFKKLSEKDSLNYILFLDAVNFCFWSPPDEPHWTVTYKGVPYSGYFALTAAVARAFDDGVVLFDPAVYANLTFDQLDKLLKGDQGVSAPLTKERLECLLEVGATLLDKFGGSFENCVSLAKGNAKALLEIIIENFPCFDDSCDFLGKRVSFHKRAQILVGDTWGFYKSQGIAKFDDIDSLTMFADYRVPQVLVALGILEYSEGLMNALKKNQLLKPGCEYEIEIRGCAIRAVDLIVQALRKYMAEGDRNYHPECNDMAIDYHLWWYRRAHEEKLESIPFHKVRTIYY
ncbi:Protein of unknown function (DUF2419) [Nesidiocoris tenuis]|uniref:Queuosine 5'-phosphate N-glycosylase/hydrolase n=1 Tax=Nesidiocoris tenuis TaxID=355587 RepID=A0ABN7APK1_9HEMI|nr:Protein of unknown function (DUF2419) [Nesidiocoris tenuis]